jgi:hypothetical protein
VYVHIYTYIYIHKLTYIYTFIHKQTHIYLYIYIYMNYRARAQLHKARELYEKTLRRKNQVDARNNGVYKQFEELSILVTDICRREFNTDIQLIMA